MVHETVFVQFHESVDDSGGTTCVGFAEKVQLGPTTVIDADPVEPQASVTVTWYEPGCEYETRNGLPEPDEGLAGPVDVHVYELAQPPEAVMVTMLPTGTVMPGVTERERGRGAFTVICVFPDFVGSCLLVAFMTTFIDPAASATLAGSHIPFAALTLAGAVYSPLVLIDPPPLTTDQVTAEL